MNEKEFRNHALEVAAELGVDFDGINIGSNWVEISFYDDSRTVGGGYFLDIYTEDYPEYNVDVKSTAYERVVYLS